jgi:cytochrome c oxidase subunit 4
MADFKVYVAIWALLVAATLLEVATRLYLPVGISLLIVGIIVISAAKAVSIALYFQHLRYEPKVLSILPLAALIVLSTLLITSILSMWM